MEENNKKPKIRFKGFTEAWEQRKVTDVGKIFIGLVTTMTKNYTDVGTESMSSIWTQNRVIFIAIILANENCIINSLCYQRYTSSF